jgi:hypothetical protein
MTDVIQMAYNEGLRIGKEQGKKDLLKELLRVGCLYEDSHIVKRIKRELAEK